MERAAWLRSFGLGRDPFDARDARHDEVLALEPLGMLHVHFAVVHGATEVPHSCLIEGVPGSGRTALCMQLVAEDEHDALHRPGLGRRVVPIDRFAEVARGVEERRGGSITACEAIDLVLHRVVPEIVDEVLGIANDGTRPRMPVTDAAAAIESAGPAVCRDLLVLQALYDRDEGAPSRTMLLRDRFALSGGVLAESSRSWGLVLLGSSVVIGIVLVALGERRDAALLRALPSVAPEWAQALPWIGLGLLLSASLGLLGRWAVAGLYSRSRVRRAMRSIVVTDRDAEDLSTCLNEWRPVDLRRVPRRGAIAPRLELLDRLERIVRLLGWRSIAVVVDGVDDDAITRRAIKALLDERIVQRSGTSVVLAAPPSAVVDLRVPCSRVTLDWPVPALRRLIQSRMDRCADRPAAAPSFDALFEPAISRAEIDGWLAHWATPKAALAAMHRLIAAHTDSPMRLQPMLDAEDEPQALPPTAQPLTRATLERVLGRPRLTHPGCA
ncbi:MAG: hypothetical protein FJ254_00840 [Phycisphaerae bacterium]|nr:hypothetical protein [Phycisphaerae bacterium]